MLLSIILAIVVIAMGVSAANLLDEEIGAMPFIAGGAVFMARWCPELSLKWLPPVMFAIMICMFIWLIWWWASNGSDLVEMIPFGVMAVIFFVAMKTSAEATTGMIHGGFWSNFVGGFISLAMLTITIGALLANFFFFHYNMGEGRGYRVAGWATIIIVIVALIAMATHTLTEDRSIFYDETQVSSVMDASDGVTTAGAVDSANNGWYYYNTALQSDSDESNNFNFGSKPGGEGWTAADYEAEFRERLRNDPALGAATMAYHDAILGTRFMGTFYDECAHEWDKAINTAKERFIADPALYQQTLEQFFAFLDIGQTEVRDSDAGLTDQMYMNPYTVSGVPDVIVMKTGDHGGKFLVTSYTIKGAASGTANAGDGAVVNDERKFETAYRIDCGYQPTNVAEVMKITPQPQPKPQPTSTPSNPSKPVTPSSPSKPVTPSSPSKPVTPSSPSKPVTPSNPAKPVKPVTPSNPVKPVTPVTPVKPVAPSYNKDKNKGTKGDVVKPNDNPGLGTNTNNGVGATKSTKDQPTNTNNGQTYNDYKADQKELAEINKTQKTGSDNNTPSYTPPSTTTTTKDSSGKSSTTTNKPKVDNNGDKGNNGGAPVNTPTPVSKPSTSAETGKPISNDASNPAGAWGGPPD